MHRTKILGVVLLAASMSGALASCADEPGGQPKEGQGQGPAEPEVGPFVPQPATMRRLLKRQYVNAVRTLLGAEAAAAAEPPSDASVEGFDAIGARQLGISDSALSAYESSARSVAAAAMGNMGRIEGLLGCAPSGPEDASCHAHFVARFGRLSWRRPLTGVEAQRYVALAQAAAKEAGDFYMGIEFAITAFLQSPNFLYMVEVGSPVGADRNELSDYELLTRMSFFLNDTTPDPVLLDMVEKEGLKTEESIRGVAAVMLARLEARKALASFYAELYRLRELDVMVKDAQAYPQFSPDLARSMKEETLRLIEDVVWERDVDVREMMSADYTFVDADLAALYGAKESPEGGLFVKASLPKEQGRAGLLGNASFLARFSHAARTSPTLRGKFVRERLLCQPIPPPPPEVTSTLPPESTSEPKTMKELLAEHQTNPSCKACHAQMDPIGIMFETFDPLGGYRTTDKGLPLDTLTQAEGIGVFSNPRELGAKLRQDPAVAMCVLRNLYRNALGQMESTGEEAALVELEEAFMASGYRVKDLLVDIVASPAFRVVGVPQ